MKVFNNVTANNENIFTFGDTGKVSGKFINYMPGIVYAATSIHKCSNQSNLNQNIAKKSTLTDQLNFLKN